MVDHQYDCNMCGLSPLSGWLAAFVKLPCICTFPNKLSRTTTTSATSSLQAQPNIANKAIINILMDTSSNCRPGLHLAPGPSALDQAATKVPTPTQNEQNTEATVPNQIYPPKQSKTFSWIPPLSAWSPPGARACCP